MFVYEPDSDNYRKVSDNLKKYKNIIIKKAGVGDKSEIVGFTSEGSAGSFLTSDESSERIQLISLDEDINEPVTYIKMDIEGFEIPAIMGAKNLIKNDHPKLAICLYHIVSDLWEIPKLIDSIYPDYRFYIRHYEEYQNWETVLYAIPPEKESRANKLKNAATIYPYTIPWNNSQLTKDCGMIPYLLHKKYNMNAKMIGTTGNADDYPSAKFVPGLELVSLPKHDTDTKLSYIAEHAKEIDLLILYGAYTTNALFANQFKENNPDGMIYCGLDANSHWMDRFDFTTDEYQKFLDSCDVISTSCTAMAIFLSKKWHRNIHLITNGYYDFTNNKKTNRSFEEKQNIILTVGRLGTDQKSTEVLLEAFALIADDIPEWTLKLIGTIEESFNEYIQSFYDKNPNLKERVIFTGPITDKTELMNEYEDAKIFALPSFWEGGAPNVISESLTCGCVTAVTKFDAWEDCTAGGKCGRASEVEDVSGFADILKELCHSDKLKEMSEYARTYASEFYNMEKNVEKIMELLKES